MSLVDDDETDVHLLEALNKSLRAKPFGRDIKKFAFAVETFLDGVTRLRHRQTRMKISSLDVMGNKVVNLVLHEGDQGGDDQRYAGPHQRGNLVTH